MKHATEVMAIGLFAACAIAVAMLVLTSEEPRARAPKSAPGAEHAAGSVAERAASFGADRGARPGADRGVETAAERGTGAGTERAASVGAGSEHGADRGAGSEHGASSGSERGASSGAQLGTLAAVDSSTTSIARWTKLLSRMRADVLDDHGAVVATSIPVAAILPPKRAPGAIALWATYCAPCVDEMPMLDALAGEGHRIAGLSFDTGHLTRVREVLSRQHVRYPCAVLTDSSAKTAGLALDSGLPFTIILDAHGDVRELLRGELSRDRLLAALARARDE